MQRFEVYTFAQRDRDCLATAVNSGNGRLAVTERRGTSVSARGTQLLVRWTASIKRVSGRKWQCLVFPIKHGSKLDHDMVIEHYTIGVK